MRIVIDMQAAQSSSRFSSIGRYSLSLTQAIVRQRGEHDVILALNGFFPDTIESIRGIFHGLLPQESIRVWYAAEPVCECKPANKWRREVAERIRESFFASLQPDVVFIPSFFEGYDDDAVTSIDTIRQKYNTVISLYNFDPLFSYNRNLKYSSAYEQYCLRKTEQLKRANGWFLLSDPPIQLSDESVVPTLEHLLDGPNQSVLSQITLGVSNDAASNYKEAYTNATWSDNAQKAIGVFESLLVTVNESKLVDYSVNTLTQHIGAIVNGKPNKQDVLVTAWAIAANHPEVRRKKLYVDISDLCQKDLKTGIQRVTRSILSALLDNSPEDYLVEPVYATMASQGYLHAKFYTNQLNGSPGHNQMDEPIDPQPGDIFLGLDFVAGIIGAQQKYLQWIHNHGVQVYFVVYDLLPINLPYAFPTGADAGHSQWLKIVTSFDGAICISRAVQSDLDLWLKTNASKRLRPFKTGWFHLGADVENSIPTKGMPDDANAVLGQLAVRPSFLMVGTVEPRKGHAQTLAAFELLWADGVDVNLVIVGKEGWMVNALIKKLRQHAERNQRLFWLEGISDEYLENTYAASICLVVASEGEGFGLPIIEAAQHNKPIIARDIPVFREVAGERAFYFSSLEPESLSSTIISWLQLHKLGLHTKSEGMKYLSWHESAFQLQNQLGLRDLY